MTLSPVPVGRTVLTQDQPQCSSNTRLCTKIAQLDQLVEAAEITLDPNGVEYLEALSQPGQNLLFIGYS